MSARTLIWQAGLGLLLLGALAWHLGAGAHSVPMRSVLQTLLAGGESYEAAVIAEIRLPRALGAMLAGAALSAAGALMQGATRNPLAEPGLFGLLAGAALAVVAGQSLLGLDAPVLLPVLAALGALGGALMVWGLTAAAGGGAGMLTPVLAGAAVTAFLAALTMLLNLLDERGFEDLRIWLSGSLAGLRMPVVAIVAPWTLAGLAAALVVAPKLTVLSLGDEAAHALGVPVARIRALALAAVVLLTASAMALAGPLAFVGLTVPHAARLIFGTGYARLLPASVLLGAIFLLAADALGRTVIAPAEVSSGILTALVGAPVFVLLLRARA
ncbi:FecCD family ABC transporter permease [Citreimonas salinaria]|uniref:Iron complex transport system permease protein n=1 Tax=Citreimonas salinaria TaxID=321339 RepID=A0A1H3LJJ2_9RHOB|nr:iron ABC transporter permease [Citreimonas salinaria]SDY64114.1 iron complex transport system permease protein [Citreimonas salinaria]